MINISSLLDEIKASPYREIVIRTPHTGRVTFAGLTQGDKAVGPQGQWKETRHPHCHARARAQSQAHLRI